MATTADKIIDLKKRQEKIVLGGGIKRIEKQHSMGKMTARERIEALLDKDSFEEIDEFVTHRCTNFGMADQELPSDGVVTGFGTVDGRLVFVYAQDFTVSGGSLGEMHAAKIVKVQQMALKMGAPIIGLNDSGGARIQEGVNALSGFGKIFMQNTMASGVIPQIAVIMGPCAGGAVYSPAIMDFVYMVQNTSQMFITGPQVIKSVTNEEVSAEQLGGAMTHNQVSGVAHFSAVSDEDCINQLRCLLSYLPSNNMESAPKVETGDAPSRMDEALNSIIPDSSSLPYNMKKLIQLIVDNGDFYEVQPDFALNIITCFARMDGKTVGIIANQPAYLAGCLDIPASDKAARFIRFCDAFNIPLISIVDVPGFLPGTDQEYSGIIRHGAKMLYAYCEATVPKVTLVTRKAFGGAYIGMCCKDLGADMVLAWPTSEIAVMGAAGAAEIIFRGAPDIDAKIKEYEDAFANPYQAAKQGYVDKVIEPIKTRPTIINALRMLETKQELKPSKKHGNIPL